MTINSVNPYPPLIFKDNYIFTEDHIRAATSILDNCDLNSHLEQGNAKSSVANQVYCPHRHQDFLEFFKWLEVRAKEILYFWQIKDYDDFYVGNSWINEHGKGGYTSPHNHGFSAISCVAYIRLPSDSGTTEFQDPFYGFKSLYEYNNEKNCLQEYYPLGVQQGDVVFFPGWLMHRSQTNYSNESRLVLSANFINFTSVSNFTLKNIL